jgi:hypothetical protein
MSLIQDLHDSEINCATQTFFDGVFQAKLGDPLNGFSAEANLDSWEELENWLRKTAIEKYPDSEFAKKYATQ